MVNRDNMIAFIERTTGYRYGETVGTLKTSDAHTGEEINNHLRRRMAYFAIDANNIDEIVLSAMFLAWFGDGIPTKRDTKARKFQKMSESFIRIYFEDVLSRNFANSGDVLQEEMILIEQLLVRQLSETGESYTIGFLQNWIGYIHLYFYALLMLNEREEVAKYKKASFFNYAPIPCNDLISARIFRDFNIDITNDIPFMECNNADVIRDCNRKIENALDGRLTKMEYVFS